jgi:hypothetical protein
MGTFYPWAKPDFIESIKDETIKLEKFSPIELELIEKIEHFQRKEILRINKNLYLWILEKTSNYLLSNKKISSKFLFSLIERLRLDDIDDFYRKWFLKVENKQLSLKTFSRFLFDENTPRLLSLLPLIKSIWLEIYPNL